MKEPESKLLNRLGQRWRELLGTYRWALIVVAVGALLMALPTGSGRNAGEASAEVSAGAAEDFDLQCLGLDPALSRTLVSRLTAPYNDAGEPKPEIACIDIPQGMLHMSPPTKDLERLIRSRKMLHVHNTCARWCFGNARCYVDANENMKLMKNRSMGRIDITVAWVIALATATIMAAQETFDKTTLGEDWSL